MEQHDTNSIQIVNGPSLAHCAWLEIRLFYVRVEPCVIRSVPDYLNLGYRLKSTEPAFRRRTRPRSRSAAIGSIRSRRSTDSVRVTGGVEFEVYENNDMVLCGSLERMEGVWLDGNAGGLENDSRTGWSMDCYMAASINSGSSSFFLPKLGVSAPSIEVYMPGIAPHSPRRKAPRHAVLDAIPEDEEVGKEHSKGCNGMIHHRKLQIRDSEIEEYESEGKIGHHFDSDEMYTGEDGQLTWFNAGNQLSLPRQENKL
ncbi:unnamed protein product [Malus baccata var. baccata]